MTVGTRACTNGAGVQTGGAIAAPLEQRHTQDAGNGWRPIHCVSSKRPDAGADGDCLAKPVRMGATAPLANADGH